MYTVYVPVVGDGVTLSDEVPLKIHKCYKWLTYACRQAYTHNELSTHASNFIIYDVHFPQHSRDTKVWAWPMKNITQTLFPDDDEAVLVR